MCLAKFAVNYDVSSPGGNETIEEDIDTEENANEHSDINKTDLKIMDWVQ